MEVVLSSVFKALIICKDLITRLKVTDLSWGLKRLDEVRIVDHGTQSQGWLIASMNAKCRLKSLASKIVFLLLLCKYRRHISFPTLRFFHWLYARLLCKNLRLIGLHLIRTLVDWFIIHPVVVHLLCRLHRCCMANRGRIEASELLALLGKLLSHPLVYVVSLRLKEFGSSLLSLTIMVPRVPWVVVLYVWTALLQLSVLKLKCLHLFLGCLEH